MNRYIKDATANGFSAKDFRTWNATVLAAVAVAVSREAPRSKAARERVVKRAVDEVAHYLGNTPTIARNSYIDPRVFDRFRDRLTIGGVLDELGEGAFGQPAMRGAIEDAVDRPARARSRLAGRREDLGRVRERLRRSRRRASRQPTAMSAAPNARNPRSHGSSFPPSLT